VRCRYVVHLGSGPGPAAGAGEFFLAFFETLRGFLPQTFDRQWRLVREDSEQLELPPHAFHIVLKRRHQHVASLFYAGDSTLADADVDGKIVLRVLGGLAQLFEPVDPHGMDLNGSRTGVNTIPIRFSIGVRFGTIQGMDRRLLGCLGHTFTGSGSYQKRAFGPEFRLRENAKGRIVYAFK